MIRGPFARAEVSPTQVYTTEVMIGSILAIPASVNSVVPVSDPLGIVYGRFPDNVRTVWLWAISSLGQSAAVVGELVVNGAKSDHSSERDLITAHIAACPVDMPVAVILAVVARHAAARRTRQVRLCETPTALIGERVQFNPTLLLHALWTSDPRAGCRVRPSPWESTRSPWRYSAVGTPAAQPHSSLFYTTKARPAGRWACGYCQLDGESAQ